MNSNSASAGLLIETKETHFEEIESKFAGTTPPNTPVGDIPRQGHALSLSPKVPPTPPNTPVSTHSPLGSPRGLSLPPQVNNASKINPCKRFFKTPYRCLGSQEAYIYNTSLGFPTVINSVFSTEPDTISTSQRLKAYTGAELFLFTGAEIATIMKEKYKHSAWEKVSTIFRYSSSLSNGFNFSFSVGSMVVARIEGYGELPGTASTYEALGTVLALSLAAGVTECYAQSRSEQNLLRRISDSLIFALSLGSLLGQPQRIYNFFPGASEPSNGLKNFFAWGPLCLTAFTLLSALCYKRKDLTLSSRMGTVNSFLQDFGTLLAANAAGENVVYALIFAKLLVSLCSYYMIKHINGTSEPLLEPLLAFHEVESSSHHVIDITDPTNNDDVKENDSDLEGEMSLNNSSLQLR